MSDESKNMRKSSGAGILVFSLILLIGLIIALVAMLPQFYINRIEIEGNRKLTDSEIIASSGIESGKHLILYVRGNLPEILSFRYADVEKRLKAKNPYIESVTVRASFPYKVLIKIKERTEVGFLETDKDYVAVDSQGMVLERLPLGTKLNAPVFLGISAEGLAPGHYLSDESKRAEDRTLTVVNAVLRADQAASDQMSLMHRIRFFFPYSANTLYIELTNLAGAQIRVRLNPGDNTEEKISWLRNALFRGAFENLGTGVIDISGKQNVFSPSQTVPSVAGLPALPKATAKPSETTAPAATTAAETTAAAETTTEETTSAETTTAEETTAEETSAEEATPEETPPADEQAAPADENGEGETTAAGEETPQETDAAGNPVGEQNAADSGQSADNA